MPDTSDNDCFWICITIPALSPLHVLPAVALREIIFTSDSSYSAEEGALQPISIAFEWMCFNMTE